MTSPGHYYITLLHAPFVLMSICFCPTVHLLCLLPVIVCFPAIFDKLTWLFFPALFIFLGYWIFLPCYSPPSCSLFFYHIFWALTLFWPGKIKDNVFCPLHLHLGPTLLSVMLIQRPGFISWLRPWHKHAKMLNAKNDYPDHGKWIKMRLPHDSPHLQLGCRALLARFAFQIFK